MKLSLNSQQENRSTFNRMKIMKNKWKRGRVMIRKNIVLAPNTLKILERMGARIKKARLRRNISIETIAERAGIGEVTYYAIEKGVATVSIGAYAAVLSVLELENDLELIAVDEDRKQKFKEQNITRRERASKQKQNI